MNNDKPFIAANERIRELTFRGVVLAILLTILLATSNAYLALKLGILTSASIPAAILSMGILRFFKHSTILENNAVQTAASAGEAVAGGIVYTIPALIIIQYWHHFDYAVNMIIAVSGGILGVLFSIPLRRILVHDDALKFPEGRAIAEVLKSSTEKIGMQHIVFGGVIGATIELLQVGFKLLASGWTQWFVVGNSLVGFGTGFSATMIGAGYMIGYEMASSIILGAILSWLIALPALSPFYPEFLFQHSAKEAVSLLWNNELRYLGIAGMLFAGCWTMLQLLPPLWKSIRHSLHTNDELRIKNAKLLRTEQDIPLLWILLGILIVAVGLACFFYQIFPLNEVGFHGIQQFWVVLGTVLYILLVGAFFSIITAYFSGMVGVSASPGSSVMIAGIFLVAWLFLGFIHWMIPLPLSEIQWQAVEAMTMMTGAVVMGIAAIANDNTQDLKVGQLVGATPWKQQVMLLIGVVVSALVIPPVMQVLFSVYGIAGVMPHAGMDATQSLPAPAAALLATVTASVFQHSVPWVMMAIGIGMIVFVLFLSKLLQHFFSLRLSILGVAVGMYLPLESSVPLCIGGLIAWAAHYRSNTATKNQQIGIQIACGLVAGSALLDVLLAIPFSIFHSPDALRLVGMTWEPYGVMLSVVSTTGLAWWIIRSVNSK